MTLDIFSTRNIWFRKKLPICAFYYLNDVGNIQQGRNIFCLLGLEDQLLGKVIQSEKAELEDMKNELQENMVRKKKENQ